MGILRTMAQQALAPLFRATYGSRKLRASAPFDGASTGRRMVSWNASDENINSVLQGSSEILRARSRDLARKNPYAINAIDSFVGNCISTGIKPQSQHPTASVKEAIQKAWLTWTDEADAAGLTDFYGLQALVCRALVEGGECFVRIRNRYAGDGLSVPMQLQVLEAEHCPVTKNEELSNGNRIRSGIEFDPIGRRVAYHLYPEHPGSGATALFAEGSTDTKRIPAEEILHVFRPLRPGQMRGQPWLAPVLATLYDLDKYDDAELMRKQVAAMFAGFITQTAPDESVLPGAASDSGSSTAPDGVQFAGLEPATVQQLLPGEDIKFAEPADVGGMYVEFMRVQLRKIAAGLGITYEQLTGDLTGVNYSSIRAGMLEFRRRAEQFQHSVMVFQFCRPVYRLWVQQAVLIGAVPAPQGRADMQKHQSVKWIAPGWPWVDPLKDLTAKRLEIRSGLTSRSAAVSEKGEDSEVIDREQQQDNQRADDWKLSYDSDGRRPLNGPTVSGEIVGSVSEGNPQDEEQPDKLEKLDARVDDLLTQINALEGERDELLRSADRQPVVNVTATAPPVTVNAPPVTLNLTMPSGTKTIKRDEKGRITEIVDGEEHSAQ